ncbi:MAG: tetratricopeptide repeat protein [Planctomycetales bacterium]|nr:tetratricopeptide repeat protein [Planctomycetales bacterium]
MSPRSPRPPELERALRSFHEGNEDETLRWLLKAQESNPDLAPAEVMLATMYLTNDRAAAGRQVLERAVLQHPLDPEPHLIFGDLGWQERRVSDAFLQYQRGYELAKDFAGSADRKRQLQVRALAGLGTIAETRRQHDQAVKYFEQLVSINPEHSQAHFRLGNLLFALGRPNEALVQFEAAAQTSTDAPDPRLTLAQLYQQHGNTEETSRWLQQAIDQTPNSPTPRLAMARWLLQIANDETEATAHLDGAEQVGASAADVGLLRGLIAWKQGDLTRAEKHLEPVAIADPQNTPANCSLASVLAEQAGEDQQKRAWELIQLVAAKSPQSADIITTAGWVAYRIGQWDIAEQNLRRAAEISPRDRDVHYYLARSLYRHGHIADARQHLEQALKLPGLFIHESSARQFLRELDRDGGSP